MDVEEKDVSAEGKATQEAVQDGDVVWYAMRDLKRPNALEPAYKMLQEKGFKVFTPMRKKVVVRRNVRVTAEVPVIQDLLFVRTSRKDLDPVEAATPTLRYRFVKGGRYREATIVRDEDMDKFITAVESTPSLKYYALEDITPDMIGRRVRVHGGSLDGFEVPLRKMRGARKKRIFVEIPSFIAAEVVLEDFDYLQFVE